MLSTSVVCFAGFDRPTPPSIFKAGRLYREAFLSWYEEWLFDVYDSSDEGQTSGVNAAVEHARIVGGFPSRFKSNSSRWKCGACLLLNPESTARCLSCKTVRPVKEMNVAAASSSGGRILGGSSCGQTGGFTLGVPDATALETSWERFRISPEKSTNLSLPASPTVGFI